MNNEELNEEMLKDKDAEVLVNEADAIGIDSVRASYNDVFLADLEKETNYFYDRLEAISKYENKFFKESALNKLAERYIRALALLRVENEYEASNMIETYTDFLTRLGIDSYCIEQEVNDYVATHDIDYSKKENLYVSNAGKKR